MIRLSLLVKNNFNYIIIILGICLSIIFLFLGLRNVKFGILISTLTNCNVLILVLSFLLISISVLIRSIRWSVITNHNCPSFYPFWVATSFGYLCNMIYPARAGEVLRILALNKKILISKAYLVTTSFVDRLFDGLTAGLFFIISLLLIDFINHFYPLIIMSVGFSILATLFFLLLYYGEIMVKTIFKIFFFIPNVFQNKILERYNQLEMGLFHLKKLNMLSIILFLSIISFISDSIACWLILNSIHLSIPLFSGVIVMLFISVGSLLPSGPGYLGMYQIACIFALSTFNVNESQAVAFSFLLQICLLFVFIILNVANLFISKKWGKSLNGDNTGLDN
jgi:uncharacterized protein (TIRG00374 family)